ncbi:TrbL/VirB6 plasmid conjugal transfer protein [mine drainage metagenome]|uniref:TrbL/VirB6 plasmid conjugal transfer protein n=1 Tax=mine drainage metagenome TaxID=410659 RepID=A0A1J5QFC4_9ZZZZ
MLLFRKAALVLIAVFAPVAFAGSAWDQTRVWTRRWLEIVAALVFCKVVIVVVFVVGASAFTGTGPVTAQPSGGSTPGITGTLSNALVGLLLLTIAVFAPWLTWRFVHWSGMEAATVMNSAVAANPILRGARGAGTQTRYAAQQAVTSTILSGAGAAAAAGKTAAAAGTKATGSGPGAPALRPAPARVTAPRPGAGGRS